MHACAKASDMLNMQEGMADILILELIEIDSFR